MSILIKRLSQVSRSLLRSPSVKITLALTLQCCLASAVAQADSYPALANREIDDNERVTMVGHLSPRARPGLDTGAVPASMKMSQMQLVFKRSPEREQALQTLLAKQHDKTSGRYHQWLTPAQYGAQFGASDDDIAIVSAWLKSKGFKLGAIPAGHAYLPFTGTAAVAQYAFRTELHYFNVNNEKHFAPVADPSIPAALKDLVVAVAGLNDFHPKPNSAVRQSSARPSFNDVNGNHLVVPADVATLYNLNPLYRNGINGAGVTVAFAAQSDIDPTVAQQYWNAVGVSQNQQLLSIAVPSSIGGLDPGQTYDGNETEAYLDAEIVGGLAPAAQIVLIRDTSATFAAQYAIDQNIAPVLNISFEACERDLGNDGNAAIAAAYQQAAAQGITVLVASGDQGVAACDAPIGFTPGDAVVSGLSVNGLASTPYNVAVGGTDFNPTLAQNWSASNDPVTLGSAQTYIPEDVWNNSCANPVLVTLTGALSTGALCNSQTAIDLGLNQIVGGGGGLSGCSVLSDFGSCAGGYAQPIWQSGVYGIGGFGSRALPDIALLADNWLVCDQSVACSPGTGGAVVLQGTSAAAPTMAAITALLDQVAGFQGNLNPLLYYLGAAQYGSPQSPSQDALSACNADAGGGIGTGCVFNDITSGSIAQPCSVDQYTGGPPGSAPAGNCSSQPGDTLGVVDLNGVDVYPASNGFDLATGLGSINGTNFVVATYELETSAQPSARAALRLR